MRRSLKKQSNIFQRIVAGLCVALLMAAMTTKPGSAQTAGAPHALNLGIIVMPTMADAEAVLQQLKAGTDFSILAKEKSTDATAHDGGYMGNLSPNELRPELRAALQGRKVGQLTDVVQLPSGFAIMKVLAEAPATSDLNPKRIASLVSVGDIRFGALVSGLSDANAVLQDYPKPDGWDRNFQTVCKIRQESLAYAKNFLGNKFSPEHTSGSTEETIDQIKGHSALAQLYAYSGEMEKSIAEWKIAYQLAESADPERLQNLDESLGATYLHMSEMENGAYTDSGEMDIFPPLHPHASYQHTYESRQAVEYFQKYLEKRPDDLEVKWLLNLAYMTLGEYPTGVPSADLIPEKDFHSKENIGRFVDVAPAAGLNLIRGAGGVIAEDFENDGLLDVIVSSVDVCDPIHFFHNNGDGTFSDRTEQAGLMDQLGGLNMIQADFNNDGCIDFVVLRGGWEFPQRMSLMRNNCNGTFTDVTEASGLGEPVETQAAAWGDIDNDGDVDLFVVNERGPAKLFHNKGDGTFEEIGHAAGIDQTSFAKGVTAADYDHDGFVDFYVTNQNGINYLYHNNGNSTFTEVGRQAGVQAPSFSFATWFFDYDNDGWPDLFVTSYLPAVSESVKSYVGEPNNAETLKLYRNKHDGTFEDVSEQVGLDKTFMPMGANFGDVDNDGYLDIYLGVGQPSFTALLPHVLLHNDQGKSFVDITQSSGTGELHKGHAIVFADLSRQGREDIIANMGGAVPADKHSLRVFENPGSENDWLNLRLVGVKSNRAAIGAEVKVTVQDGTATPRLICRTVGETSSFGSNPLEQNIGLGRGAHSMTVDVYWPASATRQHFTGVTKNQYLEIKEFATSYTKLEKRPFKLGRSTPAAVAAAASASH
jgi:tetratricopeptide (TPR) repeat protein